MVEHPHLAAQREALCRAAGAFVDLVRRICRRMGTAEIPTRTRRPPRRDECVAVQEAHSARYVFGLATAVGPLKEGRALKGFQPLR
jgi:hypothetical protein